jgi:hypothetical protein
LTVPSTLPRVRLAALAAALLLAVVFVPAAPRPAAASGGSSFVTMANGYRADANRGPVSLHAVVDRIAVERGHQVAQAGALIHDFDYIRERLEDEGICWRGFGEILARNGSGDYGAFGNQWYNSTTHRNIMLGDYTHAGGHREQAGGRWYGTMIFVKVCNAASSSPTTSGFTDLGTSSFIDDIEWLVEQGITSGCSATRFCPRDAVARGEMATFLRRALDLPGTSEDYFSDDESSTHEVSINRARFADIASGCTATRYCPLNGVTRGQMASFLARALDLPPAVEDHFGDDEGSTHEDAINRLADAGIASGCTATRFCAGYLVTREQMAAFLKRALT